MTNIDSVARDYAAARTKTKQLRDKLRGLVLDAIAEGMSEAEAARRAGVTRITVRTWQGKGK